MSSLKNNTPSNTQTDKKKRKVFGDEETQCLLEIWSSDKIQKQFYATTRHNLIFESISRQLNERGFTSTSAEVKSKIRNLKTEYRSKKPKSGGSTPDWKYFSVIHEVLGQRDAANDDLMEESLADSDDNIDNARFAEFIQFLVLKITPLFSVDVPEYESHSVVTDDPEVTRKPPSHSHELQNEKLPAPGPSVPNEPRIRKISRPPHSREDKLIDVFIKTEETFQKRFDAMDEVEKRNEKRDDLVASSMTRFLNAFAVLAENSAKHITPSFSLVPSTNINANSHENTVTRSVAEVKKSSSVAQNDIQPPFVATVASVKRKNRCGKSTSSVPQSQDQERYALSNLDADYVVENVDVTDSVPSEPSNAYELEHFDSFLRNLDNDMDDLPEFGETNRADERETDVDPVFEFIKSEMNPSVLGKPNKSKKLRIISDEHLLQPYNTKKTFVRERPNIFDDLSVAKDTSPTYSSSKQRLKSGSIIISKEKYKM